MYIEFKKQTVTMLPFHENFNQLRGPLRKLGIRLVFKNDNTIGNHLIRNSPKRERGAVYKIDCTCSKFYIGQTGKLPKDRVKEHMSYIRRDEESSALNIHYRGCNRDIMWMQVATLFQNSSYFERNILESRVYRYLLD